MYWTQTLYSTHTSWRIGMMSLWVWNNLFSKYVTGYGKTNHSRYFVETEIITPSESTFIADHNGTFTFSIGLSCAKLWAFECEQYASWFRSHAVLITHVNSERVGLPVRYAVEHEPESMRTRISRYTAEVLRIRLLCTLEVEHAIEVRVLTIELWTHVT